MDVECGESRCYSLDAIPDSGCFGFLFRKANREWFQACCAEHECFLVDACMPAMLQFAQKHANNTVATFDISKALARLMIILNEKGIMLRECDEDKMFDFVSKFWDYVSEAVCHDCVSIFESLMKLHLSKCKRNGAMFELSSWARNVGKFLSDTPSSCRGRYRCMLAYQKIFTSMTESFTDDFCVKLYSLLSNPTLVVVVSDLIAFDIVKNFADPERRLVHSNLLHASLQSPAKAVRSAVQERLLPAFARNTILLDWVVEEFERFLEGNLYGKTCLQASLFATKFCVFHQKGNDNILDWTSFIDEHIVIAALLNADLQIRLMVWNLICDHPKLVAPISDRQLLLCKCFLVTNMAEQSPAVRLTILSGLKKILIRIREFGQNLLKNDESDSELKPYVDFICALRDLCFESLVEYANFSRRIMALRMLEYLFTGSYLADNNKDLFFKFISPELWPNKEQIHRIIRCLDDSYQLCQISALRLLASPFFEIDSFDFSSYLSDTKRQMFSVRSLFTLTSGYRLRFYLQKNPTELKTIFHYLLDTCKDRVKLITDDFLTIATNQGFVYSVLNAISVVLELLDFQSLDVNSDWCVALISDVLLPMCFGISDLVAPVVNSMSPEGFVPDDHIKIIIKAKNFETLKESTDFCQLLLASCWRSHKHVSAIFHIIVTKLLGSCTLSLDTVQRISNYYWRQLTECKHCGAIETAIEGFEALCAKLWLFTRTGNSDFKDFPHPEIWMQQIIGLLSDDKNTLCATRRSAGLPYLVVSILATEPIVNNAQCLKTAITSLLELEGKSYEAQVHSINILRAIFSDSRLSEQILSYLESAMNLCFICFGSDCWAVRNAASQLFAALLTRMFGVSRNAQRSLHPHQKNRLSSFEFFTRFPSLYESLHQQFQENDKSISQLRMFAVLILLTHLFPSPRHAGIYSLTTYILPVLNVLLTCRAMKLRELATAALVSICEIQDAHFLLKWISAADLRACTQNEICAVLLLLIELAAAFDGCEIRNSLYVLIGRIEDDKHLEKWCDYNKSLFLALILQVQYQITISFVGKFISSDAVLVLRPLAKWAAGEVKVMVFMERRSVFELSGFHCDQRKGKKHVSSSEKRKEACELRKEAYGKVSAELKILLMNSSCLRFEFWRALSKSDMNKFDDPEMLQLAAEDLLDSGPRVQRNILTLFVNNTETICWPFDINGLKCLLHELIGKTVKHSNGNLVRLLLLKLDSSDWCFEWLYSCGVNEDQEVQWIAVKGLEAILKKGCSNFVQLVKIIVLLLQNENETIREKVSELCSQIISPNIRPLNPQILFWWFVKNYPEVEETIRLRGSFDSNEHTELFDACVANPYAEAIPIGIRYLDDVMRLIL